MTSQVSMLAACGLRSCWRARCVPDRPGNQGIWRTFTDRGRYGLPAAMLIIALPALLPKLIVEQQWNTATQA